MVEIIALEESRQPTKDIRWPCHLAPYMGHRGICRCEGYGFQAVYSSIGYINKSFWVEHRLSFFTKLTRWLKFLFRLRKPVIYSSIG